MAHIESSLIWIGSLKVEWVVRPTSTQFSCNCVIQRYFTCLG
jgi:uncharacterized membrane protein